MDKETLSNYGWIVICVLVLAVMLALATPFGTFVADAIKSTTQGLFDVNQNALNSTGLINIDSQEFESCPHDYETTTTANCTTAGTTTHTCKLCGKSYSEEVPATGHVFNNHPMSCSVCNTGFANFSFTPSSYDSMMGTTTATDAVVNIPQTFVSGGKNYKTTYISNYAFQRNKVISSVVIPEGTTGIGCYVFAECTSLKTIVVPNTVTSIGGCTFEGCTSLESVVLSGSITKIDVQLFKGCTSLTSITFNGTVDQWNAMSKGTSWNYNVPATEVVCSDGTVSLS